MRLTRATFQLAFLGFVLELWAGTSSAVAQLYINEVYLDPPGSSGDLISEYIELRGLPNQSLADHYLIVIENETSATANPGQIEAVFNLGSLSSPILGSNGYLTLRQGGSLYTSFDPQANNLQNTAVSFTWGSGALSSVGFTDEGNNGVLENSGGTFMLVKNNGGALSAPTITSPNLVDLDVNDNNELDAGTILDSWTILDSIGINCEASDINGLLYAPVNFSAGTPAGGGHVPAGAVFVDVGYEIEYFGRWGNSTGATAEDWHMSNLTNDPASGYDGPVDLRQSAEPHGINTADQFVETSQGVPYGTLLGDTLGSSNLFIKDGDFEAPYNGEEFVFDGDVDGRDFLTWQRNYGFGLDGLGNPKFATRRHGDANRDRLVGDADLALWAENYGFGGGPLLAASLAVPEPATALLLLLSCLCLRPRPAH